MTFTRSYVYALLISTGISCDKPQGSTNVPGSAVRSAVAFTQAFYDWYRRNDNRLETAVAQHPEMFAAPLLTALRTDIAAQAEHSDEIVGLDWDPFTNSQDPCDPYRVASASRRGDTILVAMKGMCADAAPRPGPDIIARLQRKDSTWVFVDFTSPSDTVSLLGHLGLLRRDREAAAARGRH